MPAPIDRSYTHDHKIIDERTVEFACSSDREKWPWLELPPRHPLLIQTQNFWASVGGSSALGARNEDKWSALTWSEWKCSASDVGHAARGVYRKTGPDDELGFALTLFDTQNREIVQLSGKGVVFRTRNFEKWREGSKRAAGAAADTSDLEFASRTVLGLSECEPSLISEFKTSASGNNRYVDAILTKENSMVPGHPYFSGSGDHVNAPHLAEFGRQVLSLHCKGAPLHVLGGEMTFNRYVELGHRFEVAITACGEGEIAMQVRQMGRNCTDISLQYQLDR